MFCSCLFQHIARGHQVEEVKSDFKMTEASQLNCRAQAVIVNTENLDGIKKGLDKFSAHSIEN